MNIKEIQKLDRQYIHKIEELHTFYLDSIAGYSFLYERILTKQKQMKELCDDEEIGDHTYQDGCGIMYKELCKRDLHPISDSAIMKQGGFKNRVKINGNNYLMLGEMCIIAAYSFWEEYLRPKIATAQGKKTDDITSDLWGDIGKIRNSIVHNGSKANKDIKKCKVITCFQPGNKIIINYEIMRRIFLLIANHRNSIFRISLGPRRCIKIAK